MDIRKEDQWNQQAGMRIVWRLGIFLMRWAFGSICKYFSGANDNIICMGKFVDIFCTSKSLLYYWIILDV
jgi:hypothetical protein